MEDVTKIDLYELLDILSSATTQEIKKAYRKKALKCHPDKNPDNPKAAELFHQLSRALEILIDESARAAYDKVLKAKQAALLRNKELDSKRKKLKEDLEERERQAQFDGSQRKTAEEKFKAEIERLRKEGSKQLEEEIEFIRQQVQQEKFGSSETADPSLYRLKVNWKTLNSAESPSSDTYNHETLNKMFQKYGEITALVLSNKKKGSALLEFESPSAALKAKQLEQGFASNPLSLSWLSGTPPLDTVRDSRPTSGYRVKETSPLVQGASLFPSMSTQPSRFPCFPARPDPFTQKRQNQEDQDFESAVLARMRQAEEQKRLAEDASLKTS